MSILRALTCGVNYNEYLSKTIKNVCLQVTIYLRRGGSIGFDSFHDAPLRYQLTTDAASHASHRSHSHCHPHRHPPPPPTIAIQPFSATPCVSGFLLKGTISTVIYMFIVTIIGIVFAVIIGRSDVFTKH
jgi:hypothetical protein